MVVRSSQFRSADGTATPHQLQTVRVGLIATAADGESHVALLRLTSQGCPSETASPQLDSFHLQKKSNIPIFFLSEITHNMLFIAIGESKNEY